MSGIPIIASVVKSIARMDSVTPMIDALHEILEQLYGTEGWINPEIFRNHFIQRKKDFANYAQHDVVEFVEALLDLIDEDYTSSKSLTSVLHDKELGLTTSKSFLEPTFLGKFKSCVTCVGCEETAINYEHFLTLHLPIPDSNLQEINLYDCLTELLKEQLLAGNERKFCSVCQEFQTAKVKTHIACLPPVLILQLQRFDNQMVKNDTLVKYPIRGLRMKLDNGTSVEYNLSSVALHRGPYSYGHYFAIVKRDGKWFQCNDAVVSEVSEVSVVSEEAYMLIYVVEDNKAGCHGEADQEKRKNRATQPNYLDVRDEHHVQGIDDRSHQLRNSSCKMGFHPDIENVDETITTAETWIRYTQGNIASSQAEREASEKLRGEIDCFLLSATKEMWHQFNQVNSAFSARIQEITDAKSRLQVQLERTNNEIHDKELTLKVAQTRLEERIRRRCIELCRHIPMVGIQKEVHDLYETVSRLKEKLSPAENKMCRLMKTRAMLEQDVAIKEATIQIDSTFCMGLRKKMPMDPKIGPVLMMPHVQC